MDRGPRGISLTAAGIDFLPPATKVIEDLEAAVSGAAQLRDRRRGTVRVSCTPLYASTFVPEVVAGFRAQFPNIDIRLLDTLNEEVIRRILIGEADLGVAPQRPTPPEIEETPLFADRIDVVCPRHHELAKQKFVTWKKVLSYPFVSLTRDFTARLQTDLSAKSSSLVISPVHEVSYLATAFGLVKIGQGITAQPLAAKPMLGFLWARVGADYSTDHLSEHLAVHAPRTYAVACSRRVSRFRGYQCIEAPHVAKGRQLSSLLRQFLFFWQARIDHELDDLFGRCEINGAGVFRRRPDIESGRVG